MRRGGKSGVECVKGIEPAEEVNGFHLVSRMAELELIARHPLTVLCLYREESPVRDLEFARRQILFGEMSLRTNNEGERGATSVSWQPFFTSSGTKIEVKINGKSVTELQVPFIDSILEVSPLAVLGSQVACLGLQ